MEGQEVHEQHQWENLSFTADVLPDLEPNDIPATTMGILRERIDRKDLVLKTSKSDGNCLFRALAKILKKKQKHHMDMRKEIVKEMKKNKHIYIKFALAIYPSVSLQPYFDQYLEDMSKEGTWGDLICIKAAANLFHVRVIVLRSDVIYLAWEIAPTDKKSKKDIFLSYLFVNASCAHYDALFPRNEVPGVDSSSPSPSDRRAFVRCYKVFVGNVPNSMTVDDLSKKVSFYGEVLDATIESEEGVWDRMGFVTMADKESMENAIAGMNGEVWDGMKVTVLEVKGPGCPYDYGL